MPETDNPRLAAYFQLVDRAQTLAFWLGVDGIRVTGVSVSLVKAIWEALDVGLSEHDIQTAVQIGEYRGQNSQNNTSGEYYPLLRTQSNSNGIPEREYHPVVWITQEQLVEAIADFDEEIDQLSDLQRADLIASLGMAMQQVYLTLLPDILISCLNDLTE